MRTARINATNFAFTQGKHRPAVNENNVSAPSAADGSRGEVSSHLIPAVTSLQDPPINGRAWACAMLAGAAMWAVGAWMVL